MGLAGLVDGLSGPHRQAHRFLIDLRRRAGVRLIYAAVEMETNQLPASVNHF